MHMQLVQLRISWRHLHSICSTHACLPGGEAAATAPHANPQPLPLHPHCPPASSLATRPSLEPR